MKLTDELRRLSGENERLRAQHAGALLDTRIARAQRDALLEALRLVYATLDQLSFTDTKITAARIKARAAIAKVEGETK